VRTPVSHARVVAAAVGLICLGLFILSLVSLGSRIRAFNSRPGRHAYAFIPLDLRSFTFAGRPVTLTDEDGPNGTVVAVKYGETTLKLPASLPPLPPELPGLARHADWLRVLRFADRGAGSSQEFQERLNQGQDRLVVVVRRPRTTADPRTGEVPAGDWVFDFHEFKPEGGFATHTLRMPKSKGDKTPKADELQPNTWEIDAAKTLMPQNPPDSLNFGRPTASFKDDALEAAGWTLPVAVVSALGLVACLAVLVAPRRTKGA
jgi:hypothetical protein